MIWDKQFGYDGAVPSSGDFDGDGKSDLAVKDTITGKWYIESISDQSISYNSSLGDFTSMNGDYNNDGNIDIVKYFSTGVWELVLSSNNFILPSGNKGCVLKDLNDLDASITSTKVCTQNSDCTTTSTCIDGFCNLSNSLCYYVPNTHSCDDGLFCTVNDTCNQGFCTGTLRSCINENPGSQIFFCDEGEKKCLAEFSSCLTDQDCQSLTSSCVSSSCLNGVCSRVNIDGECNDENNCTVNDSCVSGTCSGVPLNLEDGNPLTYGTCLTNGTVIQEYFNFSGLSTNTSEDIWADTDLRINLSNSTNVGVSNNNSFFNQNRSDSNNPDGKNNSILFFVIFSVIILIILFSLFFFYYFGRKNKAVQKETNDSPKNSYPPSPNLSRTILKPMLYRQRPEFK
jgi:hypothetical protein